MEQLSTNTSDYDEIRPAGYGNHLFPQSFYVGIALAVAFIAGLALGFAGRPWVMEELPIEVVVTVMPPAGEQAVAPPNEAPASTIAPPTSTAANSSPPAEKESSPAQPTPTIMDFVLSDARHFQGNRDAPVTIVEFSDFK